MSRLKAAGDGDHRAQAAPATVDCAQLKRRYELLKTARSPVEAVWDQIEKFIGPFGSGLRKEAEGDAALAWQKFDVWDSSAIEDSEKLAASIFGSVMSPAIRWYRLTFRDKELGDHTEAAKALDENGDRSFDALQESDFNTESASGLLDLVRYGNMFIVCEAASESEWEGLDFTSVPLREAYFEEDSKGGIKTFYRRFTWTAVQMVDKFGEEGVPEKIRELAAKPEGAVTTQEVVFCISERPAEAKKKRKSLVLAPRLRPYCSCYFLHETAEMLGEEGGYYEMPVFLARWQRTAGSAWGHGPGHLALPTVKLLNALCEGDVGAVEKVIDPAVLTTERGLMSDLDLSPGGMTVVRDLEKSLKVFESAARFDVTHQKIADLRGMVRRIFHTDELQLKDSPAMTATEAQIRYELMNRLLGSTLSRLQSDYLSPLLHLILRIMFRAGKLKRMPPEVIKAGGDIRVDYQGPLSRAQRTDEVAAIERVASFIAALTKLKVPEALEVFNVESSVREVAKRLGVPADVLISKLEMEKKRKQREAAQAAMLKAQVAQAHGDAAQAVGAGRAAMAGPGGAPGGGSFQAVGPAAPPPILAPTLEGA